MTTRSPFMWWLKRHKETIKYVLLWLTAYLAMALMFWVNAQGGLNTLLQG